MICPYRTDELKRTENVSCGLRETIVTRYSDCEGIACPFYEETDEGIICKRVCAELGEQYE